MRAPASSRAAVAPAGQRRARLTGGGGRSFGEIRARCRRGRPRRPRAGAARRSPLGTDARPPRHPPPRARTSAPAASFRAPPRPPSAPASTAPGAAEARGPPPPAAAAHL